MTYTDVSKQAACLRSFDVTLEAAWLPHDATAYEVRYRLLAIRR
jgi:hypothetical protein